MTLPTILACAITFCGAAAAQRPITRLFPLQGVFDVVESRDDTEDKDGAADRLAAILKALPATNGEVPTQRQRLFQFMKGRDAMIVAGTREDIELVDGILKQLRLPDHPELRVQCTILTMPSKLATAHGLARGKPKSVKEAEAGKILKQCIAQAGTLKNLPECGGLPMQPFVIKHRSTRPSVDPYSAHCEAVMFDATGAAFTVRLLEDQQKRGRPKAERVAETFRIEVGSGVMLASRPQKRAPEQDQTIVLWFRFISAKVPEAPRPARKR